LARTITIGESLTHAARVSGQCALDRSVTAGRTRGALEP
jgi:hypothetical protein